jgi:hypothetical protein
MWDCLMKKTRGRKSRDTVPLETSILKLANILPNYKITYKIVNGLKSFES